MTAGNEPKDRQILLTVAYDSGIDERVTETLNTLGVPGWTKTFGAHGCGGVGRKLDNPIWPGSVNVLFIVLPAADVERVAAALRELKRSFRRNPGLMMWTHEVTVL